MGKDMPRAAEGEPNETVCGKLSTIPCGADCDVTAICELQSRECAVHSPPF